MLQTVRPASGDDSTMVHAPTGLQKRKLNGQEHRVQSWWSIYLSSSCLNERKKQTSPNNVYTRRVYTSCFSLSKLLVKLH